MSKNEDFINDINQDLRDEQIQKIWQNHGSKILTVIFLIIAASAAFNIWKNYTQKKINTLSEQFVNGQNLIFKNDLKDALGIMNAVGKTDHQTYQILANFSEAEIYTKEGPEQDFNKALKIYESIISNKRTDGIFKNLATIYATNIKLNQNLNQETIDAAKQNLEPLATEGLPFNFLAKELLAVIAYKEKKNDDAIKIIISVIQNEKAPQNLKVRLQLLSQIIEHELGAK